jgi:hypothetical protein
MPYALCDFLNRGAVAQLGERQNRTLEADGSIPFCPTNKNGVRHHHVSNPVSILGTFSPHKEEAESNGNIIDFHSEPALF